MRPAAHSAAALGVSLLASFAAASLGGIATASSVSSWYAGLAKPTWTPPDWLFGPVWTLLYTLMAVAAWIVWRGAGWGRPLQVYLLQYAFNAAWSFAFFGLRSPLGGLIVIAGLLAAIALTIRLFAPVSRTAAWLLAPYLAWVSFAACLNAAIWLRNM